MSTEPTFQAELAGLLAQMAADDRHAFMEHRRKALRLAEFGLARAVELLRNPAATPGQQVQATRLLLEHGRELFPREVELAVSSPELDQPGQESRTLADIFVMPEGADDAVVIDLGREVHRRLNADSHARGEMTEGEQHAAMAQQRGMAMDGKLAPPRTPGYAYPTEEETRRADMAEGGAAASPPRGCPHEPGADPAGRREVKTMAQLKGLSLGLLATDRGEASGGRVPPNRAASGNRRAHEARPAGPRVPKLTSSSGDLGTGPTFSRSDPYAKKAGQAGGR